MKKILLLLLSLSLASFYAFADQADSTALEKKDSIVNPTSQMVAAEKGQEQVPYNSSQKPINPRVTFILSIVALSLGLLALGAFVFVFLFAQHRFGEMRARIQRKNDECKYEIKDIDTFTKNSRSQSKEQFDHIQQAIEDLKEEIALLKAPSPSSTESYYQKDEPTNVPPAFIPQSFYGIYKSHIQGINVDDLSEYQEDRSTVVLETTGQDQAQVHLLKNLSATQMGILFDKLIDVVEGNQKEYQFYNEVEAGEAEKQDDVWFIKKKIKVRLF